VGSGAISLLANSGTTQLNVGSGTVTGGSLSIDGGSSGKTSTVIVGAGTLNITGNVSFPGVSSSSRLTFTAAGTANIGGNLGSGGTLTNFTTGGGSTIDFTGATSTAGPYTYQNLVFSGAALASGATVGTSGNITINTGGIFNYIGMGTITMGGTVTNNGTVQIWGGTETGGSRPVCGSGPVTLTASGQKNWLGTGTFITENIAVHNQTTSLTFTCYGCTDNGGNTGSWASASYGLCSNPLAPTLVRFHAFSAIPQDGGVLLQWRTGHEVDNLGFHVYRDGVRLTRSPIAGSALLAGARTVMTAGNSYSWFDAEGTSSSTYTLEDLDLDGTRTAHGPFWVDTAAAPTNNVRRAAGSRPMRAGAPAASLTLSQVGRAGSGEGRWFTTSAVDMAAVAPATSSLTRQQSALAAAQALGGVAAAEVAVTQAQITKQYALALGPAVKLGVRQDGWYHVDAGQLAAAGMPTHVNPSTLQLFVNGKEQDILVQQQGGVVRAVEFYATGVDTTWSDTQIYWLTWGSRAGQRIQSSSGKGKGTSPTSFPFTVQWKPRMVYFAALVNGDADNFFGPGPDATDPVTQPLPVTNVSAGTPGTATLQVRMQGVTAGPHMVGVQINGQSLGSVFLQDQESGASSFAVPNAWLAAGATLTLTAQGGSNDVTFVDTVTLTYPHTYAADGDALRFTAPSGQPATITGFSTNQIRVMDVTDPANVTAPQGTVALPGVGGSWYSMSVVPQGGGTRTLLAFTNAQMSPPASVEANQPSSWHLAQAGADLVVISHGDFIRSLDPLVALRQAQGLKVAVVNVEDLYDEFNFGVLSPYAVKDFLATARTAWKKKPRWVLLAGDATFDPRDYLDQGQPNYVPVELVGTTQLETASDDWFGDFNGDGIPEMAFGRLPVHDVSDAAALVAKIVAYDTAAAADWKNKALLAAGTNDADNDFEGYIAAVQGLLPQGMNVTQVLQGSDPDPAASFLAAFNSGQGLVNFSGHGSIDSWKDDLFTSDTASTLANGVATPFVMAMTCMNGYFQDVWFFSLAEALLAAPGGGAVGVWASSGLTESAPQATMNQAMIAALYGGGSITVGEAAVAAKRAVSDQDVRKTWILFGDPSMKLR
jgi:hypothetical protein